MRTACQLARKVLITAGESLRVGMTTDEIDQLVLELCIEHHAYPSPLNYRGFPKAVCTSVNNVICHGIPDSRPLADGDIINVSKNSNYKKAISNNYSPHNKTIEDEIYPICTIIVLDRYNCIS